MSAWSGWFDDHDSQIHRQLAAAPAGEQVVQAVRLLRRHDRRRGRDVGEAQVDVSSRTVRRSERTRRGSRSGRARTRRVRTRRAGRTRRRRCRCPVDVLLGVDDVAVVRGDELGRRRDDALLVGAGEQQDGSHRRRSSRSAAWAECVAGDRGGGGGIERVDAVQPSGSGPVSRGRGAPALSPDRSDPISTPTRSPGVIDADRRRRRGAGSSRRARCRSSARELPARSVVRAWGSANTVPIADPERPAGERVGAGVVEDQAVPAERGRVADDRADVGRVVDGFDDHEPRREAPARRRSGGADDGTAR